MIKNNQAQKQVSRHRKSFGIILGFLVALAACTTGPEESKEVVQATENPDEWFEKGLVQEMNVQPSKVDENAPDPALQKGVANNLNFSDEKSLSMLPNANSTFVTAPGYTGLLWGGEEMPLWLSDGPSGREAPGDHYHIVWDSMCQTTVDNQFYNGVLINGVCTPVYNDTKLDRYHIAMFGDEWFMGNMRTAAGAPQNFNLYRIRVRGTVPIILVFKDANDNWWHWPQINPGYWNLPGATNIKEFHIRATSKDPNDKYSLDDIMVKPV